MFTDSNVRLIVDAAQKNGIAPHSLLAVVECETAGQPFEVDGRTPRFLYERHVAYRHARAAGQSWLQSFVSAGLAIPKWSRKTQYQDQKTSAMRLALIKRARQIHEEIANASASWGLGQSMGENGPELGFESATALVQYMIDGGLPAQIDVLIREIKSKRLIDALNKKDFTAFARKYNGPGYAQNQYDTRMAAAEKRWARKLDTVLTRALPPAHQFLNREELKGLQSKLKALGYTMVGIPDGVWGANTVAALNAFQHYEGLPESGDFDEATKAALESAEPRVQSKGRVEAKEEDLKGKSRTIDAAGSLKSTANAGKVIGGLITAGGAAQQGGLLGEAQETIDKVNQAKGMWDTVHTWVEPFTSNPTVLIVGIVLVVGGYFVTKLAKQIIEARLEDHRSGAHTGASE